MTATPTPDDGAALHDVCKRWGWDGEKPLKDWLAFQFSDLECTKKDREEIKRTHATFSHWWYSLRMSEMDAWMRLHAPEEVKNQYFSIVANGSAGVTARPASTQEERAMYQELTIQLDRLSKERAENYPNGYTREIAEAMSAMKELETTDLFTKPRGFLMERLYRVHGVLSMMLPATRRPAPDAAATTALYVCNFLAGFNVSPMEFVDEVEGLIRRHMGCGSGDPPKNLTLPENASTDTPLPHGASHPETQ